MSILKGNKINQMLQMRQKGGITICTMAVIVEAIKTKRTALFGQPFLTNLFFLKAN